MALIEQPSSDSSLPVEVAPSGINTPEQQVRGAIAAGNTHNALRLFARFISRGAANQITRVTAIDAFVAIVNDRTIDEQSDVEALAHHIAKRFPSEKARFFSLCTQRGRTDTALAFV